MKRQFQLPSAVFQYSEHFLDETIAFWQPRSPNRILTHEDARAIISNIVGFFQVLREWDEEDRVKKKQVPKKPRPLSGLELKRSIISTTERSYQIFEIRKMVRGAKVVAAV